MVATGQQTRPVRDSERVRSWDPALLLVCGGIALLAALSAAAVVVYSESATTCRGLLLGAIDSGGVCDSFYDQRRTVVTVLVVVGLALVLAAVLAAVSRSRRSDGVDTGRTLESPLLPGAVGAGLLAPLAYPFIAALTLLFIVDRGGLSGVGLPEGWQHLSIPIGAVLACLCLRATGVTRRTALAAAALAVPAMSAIQVGLGRVGEYPSEDQAARIADNPAIWLLSGVAVTASMLVLTLLQRRGFRAPPELVSAGLVLVSTFVTTIVLLPQVLPWWREDEGSAVYSSGAPGPEVWAPMLAAPLLLSVVVVMASCLSRRSARPATAG